MAVCVEAWGGRLLEPSKRDGGEAAGRDDSLSLSFPPEQA